MTDLPTLLLSYGVELRARGQEYIAKCIAHDDNNPSMSIYRNGNDKWKCHCFSCGFHEGERGVVMHMENCTASEADIKLGNPVFDGGKRYARILNDPHAIQEKRKPRTMLTPPDNEVPRMDYLKDRDTGEPFGEPEAYWAFRNEDGIADMYEARYIFNGRKEPRVFSYGQRGVATPKWECAHHEGPRPIYARDRIAKGQQVAIFEGCRKAAKAQELLDAAGLGAVACTAWAGGANAWHKADWSPIYGKTVLLFPDHDEPGHKAMRGLARHLTENGCVIYMVSEDGNPEGWDICDREWTPQEFAEWAKANKREWKDDAPEDNPKEQATDTEIESIPPAQTDPLPVEAYERDDTLQWSEPLDIFTELQAPSIKQEFLPVSIAQWVEDVSGVIGVDPSMVALPAIVAAASMIHDGIQIQPEINNPGWRESARLWGALVGDPSSKKSPAMSKVLGIVKKIDSECHEKEGKLKYEFSLKEKAHAAQEKEYVLRLQQGDESNPPIKPEMPEIPRAYAQDCTVEALRDILKHSSRGVLAERDELSGWFGSMDQYKSGGKGGSDRANWLELYNGGSRRIDRVGVGSIFVKNWSACLIGGIQPEPLKELASKMNDDGLLQRFMVVYGRAGKPGNEATPNKALDDQYRAIMRQLWDTQPDHSPVILSAEANEIRKEIVARAYELINIKFVSNSMVAHLGKWEGLSARLMLTFHAIDCAHKHIHPQSCKVSADTAALVKGFMLDFLLPHSVQFYMEILGGSEQTKHFHAIANLILTHHQNEISLRDMARGWIGWRHTTEQVQNHVINRLTDAGWIQPPIGARVSANRRIHTRYICNPMLQEKFARQAQKEKSRRDEARQIIESIRAIHAGD